MIIVCEHVYWDDLYSVWLEKLAKHVETWYIILGTPSSNKKKEFDFSSSTAINIVFCGHITAAFVYKFAKSDKLITSIPDLNTYHFQKSKTIKDFVYIQHSLVSSQMVYLENAFDNFDTVMCANEYQLRELELRERLYQLPVKRKFLHGYGRLEHLSSRLKAETACEARSAIDPQMVLLALSWAEKDPLISYGVDIISKLLSIGSAVIVRPHPMTVRRHAYFLQELSLRFGSERITMDLSPDALPSMIRSSSLISDWSGIALEYYYLFDGKPIFFLDTPPKIRNSRWAEIDSLPLEILVRGRIGHVISVDMLDEINLENYPVKSSSKDFRDRICIRAEGSNDWIYNWLMDDLKLEAQNE